jgi:phage terminase large subunit-like protein
VPLVAFNGIQAQTTLMRPIRHFVHHHDELERRVIVYTSTTDRRVWSAWNDGDLVVRPADSERLQGLNPTVALIDEAQTVDAVTFNAVLQGAGKRAASLVLAIGTPAPGAQTSALFELRERAREGAPIAWVEYSAEMGCRLDDEAQWAKANPALRAGMLFKDVLRDELRLVDEVTFRMYRLGQWIDATLTDWLPGTAWDDCPHADPPPDGAEVVLGLAGTWTSSIALVGATPDGAVFLAYSADQATDDELEEVLSDAWTRWNVLELIVAPRTRANLVRRLTDSGLNVNVWPNRTDLEVSSSTEWRRAIVEGRLAHDHDATLAQQVRALVGHPTPDGSLKLGPPDDGTPVDAARAAKLAWWRALELADSAQVPAIY